MNPTAKEVLEAWIDAAPRDGVLERKVFDLITEALEKQVPVNPDRISRSGMGYDYKDYVCKCGNFLGYQADINYKICNHEKLPKYCSECWQKLDWSIGGSR